MSKIIRKPKLFIKIGNTKEFEISDKVSGAHFLTLKVGAPQSLTNYRTQVGIDGSQQLGDFTFGPLPISADFYLEATDHYDYRLACGGLYDAIFSRGLIRIRDDLEPGKCALVYAKPFEQTKLNYAESTFTVEFEAPSGFRQSVVRSDDDPVNLRDDVQWGQSFPLDGEPPKYRFKSNAFSVYNPSSVAIEPLEKLHDLNVLLKVAGQPVLRNITNGSKVTITKQLNSSQTLLLQGPKAFVDSVPIGSKCTGDVWLSKGINEFEVTGCTLINSIIFSFPFLYH
ncbi:hypothetical protein [Lactobacillus curvatus] [Lactiplantibacillus mudanjiangensis]|uniref:phage tail domain-containing protein n=1 Tax=Lactiplantibacillus mudanjiangensis TaxID=1296538 RepID=UPI001014AE59|nr:hypothetical protein [Lactobacillus curvatus] [Lactiplantibacillus mudanjiangensis]